MPTPLPPPGHELLAALRRRDNAAYATLFTCYYPAVERWVVRNSGTPAEAQDIFQETVLVLLTNVATPNFTLTSALKTHLLAISNNLWIKHLRQVWRVVCPDLAELADHLPAAEPAVFTHESEAALLRRVRHLMVPRSAKCLAPVRALFFGQQTIQDVTRTHGYTSVHNARNQKYKCLEQARRGLRRDLHQG